VILVAQAQPMWTMDPLIAGSSRVMGPLSHLMQPIRSHYVCESMRMRKYMPGNMEKIEIRGSNEPAGSGMPAGKLRVLCAEDSSDLRECLHEVLNRAGYEVTAVENGEQAWDEVQSSGYDLLVTDHEMPQLTGAELALRIRTQGMSLPIIVITGSGSFYTPARCRFLDISAVLEKPFALSDLSEAVGRTLCRDHQIGWRDQPVSGFPLETACGPLLGSIVHSMPPETTGTLPPR